MNTLQICPLHLSYVATLPWEIQKRSFFSIIIHILQIIFTLPQKKTNSNCCTPALAVCLLSLSASYYLHIPSTAFRAARAVTSLKEAEGNHFFQGAPFIQCASCRKKRTG